MQSVKRVKEIPDSSLIKIGFDNIDYWDSYKTERIVSGTIENITTDMFELPNWANILLSIRNRAVKIFGLKTDSTKSVNDPVNFVVGSKAGFFNVIDRNENEIVLGENDKHLNFRVSVLIKKQDAISVIYLITIVKFNNIWGWIYFLPVKPFHQLIIKTMLKNL